MTPEKSTEESQSIIKCKGCNEEVKKFYLSSEQLCYKCDKEKKMKQTDKNLTKTTETNESIDSNNTFSCNNCGSLLSKETIFCGNCGQKIEKIILNKYCTNCGKNMTSSEKFCPECGTPQMNESSKKEILKKEIPAYVLFLIALVSYGISYSIGGIIGDSFGVLGLICLLLSIVRFIREQTTKRKK